VRSLGPCTAQIRNNNIITATLKPATSLGNTEGEVIVHTNDPDQPPNPKPHAPVDNTPKTWHGAKLNQAEV